MFQKRCEKILAVFLRHQFLFAAVIANPGFATLEKGLRFPDTGFFRANAFLHRPFITGTMLLACRLAAGKTFEFKIGLGPRRHR